MQKPSLLLLHGALGSKDQFNELKRNLTSSFDVHSLDFEGHGTAPLGSEGFSIELFTQNVINYLNANNIEKTHIFGYSMGGYVGLNVAFTQPKLVEKVITLGTKYHWTPEIAEKEIKMLNPEKIAEKVPAFAAALNHAHSANPWKDVVRNTATLMHGLGHGKGMDDGKLSGIQQEVLVIVGDEDFMVTVEESNHAASVLQNGTLQVVEGGKHQLERWEVNNLMEIISSFLDVQ